MKKLGKILLLVIHDPDVQRTGKAFAAKIAVRVALALGGGAFYVALITKLLG